MALIEEALKSTIKEDIFSQTGDYLLAILIMFSPGQIK